MESFKFIGLLGYYFREKSSFEYVGATYFVTQKVVT